MKLIVIGNRELLTGSRALISYCRRRDWALELQCLGAEVEVSLTRFVSRLLTPDCRLLLLSSRWVEVLGLLRWARCLPCDVPRPCLWILLPERELPPSECIEALAWVRDRLVLATQKTEQAKLYSEILGYPISTVCDLSQPAECLQRFEELQAHQVTGPRARGLGSEALLVVGMHRSGTSATAGVLQHLGLYLGEKFLKPDQWNRGGYWESPTILQCNDGLLHALGRKWDDPRPIPDSLFFDKSISLYRRQLLNLLKKDFAHQRLWVAKEPRTCLLLPIWHGVLRQLGCTPNFIIPFRHPAEVAASLARRDDFSRQRAIDLWLHYVTSVEKATRGFRRVFFSYDQLLRDWRQTMERVLSHFDLNLVNLEGHENVDRYLSSSERHHQAHTSEPLPRRAQAAYDSLLQLSEDAFAKGPGDVLQSLAAPAAGVWRPLAQPALAYHIQRAEARPDRLRLEGWCYRPEAPGPAVLELRSHIRQLAQIRCDEFRAHLGAGPPTHCGFSLEIEVCNEDRWYELSCPATRTLLHQGLIVG